MSFGGKTFDVFRALEAEPGGLPSNLRPTEIESRVAKMLKARGHKGAEVPNRKTIFRHYQSYLKTKAKAVDATPNCPLCPVHDDAAGLISDAKETTDNEGYEMQAEPRSLQDITMASRGFVLDVKYNHPIDAALAPQYLRGCVVNVGLRPGDVIELRAANFYWAAKLLIVSVNRAAWSATTRLLQPPTFLLDAIDNTPAFLVEQINAAQQDFQQGKISQGEYEERNNLLLSLRDHGRYPSPWLAAKLVELGRALDAKLLTRTQQQTAAQELFALMSEEQALEVTAIIGGDKTDLSPAASATLVREVLEKPKKMTAKPTIVPPTTPPPPASA